jgi:UDPglucose 6-dehydrogenase
MRVCVFGLWHLGCVTAACVAEHFPTIALDPDPVNIAALQAGRPPISEPGLTELIEHGLASGNLSFTADFGDAAADIYWVTFDTPVDENDQADAGYVEDRIAELFPHLPEGATVLISSQMPAGSTQRIAKQYRDQYPERKVSFAYSPENLRLGKALQAFRSPNRIVVGHEGEADKEHLQQLLEPFCDRLLWMSIPSAEMTKHALNSFLANSVAFANEIGALCEEAGADAKEVEQGLKTDVRIGPGAYLGAGGAYAGGTLARDVSFLIDLAARYHLPAPLLESIRTSNDLHKNWPRRKLESTLGELEGKTVAVLGLTYKPGTDTLRRSSAVELCDWLLSRGAHVKAFDPSVQGFRDGLDQRIQLCPSSREALDGCDAAVIATEWPQFREITAQDVFEKMKTPVILDANRFLSRTLAAHTGLIYIAVGTPK